MAGRAHSDEAGRLFRAKSATHSDGPAGNDFFNSIGQSRRFGHVSGMSAYPPRAALKRTSLEVAFGPQAVIPLRRVEQLM
jgi:hypothetical protein